MSLEQRLERVEKFLAVLVAERMAAKPNADGYVPKDYPKDRNKYADPEDKAYPLDTRERVKSAARFFAKYKNRYSPEKRAEIAKRIEAAKKRFKIGEYREGESAVMSVEEYRDAIETVMSIVESSLSLLDDLELDIEDEEEGKEREVTAISEIMRDLLASEENKATERKSPTSEPDAMVADFLDYLKHNGGGR